VDDVFTARDGARTVTALVPALGILPADPADAAAHFAARLAFRTDVADVRASLSSGALVLLDSRSAAGWAQGRVPGAVHLLTAEIPHRAAAELDRALPVVTSCWGPGCDGAVRAALALARCGFRVEEMVGGIEYWIREGFPVETATGPVTRSADPLVAPCGC
jgi:rhodanese-related sulfurtransferase